LAYLLLVHCKILHLDGAEEELNHIEDQNVELVELTLVRLGREREEELEIRELV
jgi:hypothetical protein